MIFRSCGPGWRGTAFPCSIPANPGRSASAGRGPGRCAYAQSALGVEPEVWSGLPLRIDILKVFKPLALLSMSVRRASRAYGHGPAGRPSGRPPALSPAVLARKARRLANGRGNRANKLRLRLSLLSSSVRRHSRRRLTLVAGVCICSRQSNFKVNLL